MATATADAASTAAADAGNAAAAAATTTSTEAKSLLDTAAKAANGNGGAPAADAAEWFYADGVKGTGARPDWYKADKYKTLAEQAKAYPELEKKHGELAAKMKDRVAPEGEYELSMPDDLKEAANWNADDPMLAELRTFGKEIGLSQKDFTRALHMLAKYEYTQEAIDLAAEKKKLGDRADQRLNGFTTWARGNLSEEQFQHVFASLGKRTSPADVFSALEIVLSATRQPAANAKGDDVSTGGATSVADLDRKYRTPDPTTKRALIETPEGRKKYREELRALVGDGDHIEVMGKK